MRTQYILIDFENVQPLHLAGLDAAHFKVLLFVGASQAKVPFELAAAMQSLGNRAQYLRIAGNGSNALDFHIAFYIGQLAAAEPSAFFHIVSKDAGFDPLIQHLKGKQILAVRSKTIDEMPCLKASSAKSLPDRVALAVTNLRQRGSSRPRTVKTLSSTLQSIFQKQLAEEELAALLVELQRLGLVVVTNQKVSYFLPEGAA